VHAQEFVSFLLEEFSEFLKEQCSECSFLCFDSY